MRGPTIVAAVVYLLFAGACFHLIGRDNAPGLALGEGLFTLFGGLALVWGVFDPRRAPAVVLAGTVPLVGWFIATPYNSGPPFLVASVVVPAAACVVGVRRALR
jgi:hypothetical protein